jgi:hypothetical protein
MNKLQETSVSIVHVGDFLKFAEYAEYGSRVEFVEFEFVDDAENIEKVGSAKFVGLAGLAGFGILDLFGWVCCSVGLCAEQVQGALAHDF